MRSDGERKGKPAAASQASPTEAILESISDGVFTVDRDWRITSFNRAAEQITGIPRTEALGQRTPNEFAGQMGLAPTRPRLKQPKTHLEAGTEKGDRSLFQELTL